MWQVCGDHIAVLTLGLGKLLHPQMALADVELEVVAGLGPVAAHMTREPPLPVDLLLVVAQLTGLDLLAALLALDLLRLTLGVESEDVAGQVAGAPLDLDPADVTSYELPGLVDVPDVQHDVPLVRGGVGALVAAVHLLVGVVNTLQVDLEAVLVGDHLPALVTGHRLTSSLFRFLRSFQFRLLDFITFLQMSVQFPD